MTVWSHSGQIEKSILLSDILNSSMIAIVMSHIHSIRKTAAIELGLKVFIFVEICELPPASTETEDGRRRSLVTQSASLQESIAARQCSIQRE
jgi:hypothetical protein